MNENKIPVIPSSFIFNIYNLGKITSITHKTQFISEDRWNTFLILNSEDEKTIKITDEDFKKYMQLTSSYGGVALLKKEYIIQCREYKDYIKRNEKEYEEYLRLSKKYSKQGETL